MATAAAVSELRLVLLGNSWSERSSAGNLILGKTEFNTKKESDKCLRVRAKIEKKDVVLINTPDLLNPNISENKLTDHVSDCVRLSDPGPHVFLLVLQPEDFTEEQKLRLCRVLTNFSDKSFDHSFILISPRKKGPKNTQYPALKEFMRQCGNRYLQLAGLGLPKLLLTHLDQVVKENNGKHVNCVPFMDPAAEVQNTQETRPDNLSAVPPAGLCASNEKVTHLPGIRILLLGKTHDKITKFGDFITQKKQAHHLSKSHTGTGKQQVQTGQWRGKPLKVLKPAVVFSLSVEKLRVEMKKTVSLCPPGPNVLLLLVKPSEFTEEKRQTLKFILSLFGPDALKHSMVISTHKNGQPDDSFRRLLRDCGERHYSMSENNHRSLMTQIDSVVDENSGAFLTLTEELMTLKPEKMKPALNLVLCGRRGAEKSSAAEAILGQTGLHSASTSSECVQHQGEVCGRLVSLVDLPALSGKPLETVMKESFRSVSLCDPEGVHAFILVLPVSPLTDEDKGELEIIQETFSSQVNDFTMILFTTESDPPDPAAGNSVGENKEYQELVQSFGARRFVFNIKNRQQIPGLLNMVEKMRLKSKDEPCSFTTETFALAQTEKISSLQTELEDLKTRCPTSCDDEEQSSECLRIVLIGKTGSGKSTSGNTILGRQEFDAKSSQTSVTKCCQKKHGEVDGCPVIVVDTPGLFDTSLSHEQVYDEMIKCISLLAPGPHVFLLALNIGRLTEEEKKTLKLIREGFGKDAEKFIIILLTGGDSLKHDKISIEEYIETRCDDSFKKLISDCGGRYHLFDNRDNENREQVSELMTKIDTMVKTNGGSCFTNEMLQEAETAIKKEMEKLMKEKEEEMKREREELQRKYEEEMKEMEERMEKQEEDIKMERQKRENELKEKEEIIKREKEDKVMEKEKREQEDRERKHQDELQRQEWEQKLSAVEKQMKLESEEKESIDRQLEETRERMREERESWERKQKEQWEKRNQEEEQRRQEEQTRIRKLQEEFEQERENYEKKRKEEDVKRKEEEERLKIQQREEIEKERKQKEKELKKMEENINEEREARIKEKQIKEKEDRERKEQEELQRQEWEQKLSALEEKIMFESKEKENIYQQLENTIKKLEEERESWERKQKESWEKRNQEEEKRRQEEETRIKKLQEEFEQERENFEKIRREEDIKRQEEEERLKIQQKIEFDEERKQKEKEHEKNINKEIQDRRKEKEKREEEDRERKEQEEHQRQEWEQNLSTLEEKIKLESEEKESIDKQLEETRKEMREERESWERKQKEWWEKRNQEEEQRRQDEETRIRKLQEEFEQERKNFEKKREEEVLRRQEEEEKLKIQQRKEIKKERTQKEKKLQEMEENIKKEREVRQREIQMREEEDRKRKEQEAHQRQEWEKKLKDMEKKMKLESKKKENIDRELEETRKKMSEERESWEKKQNEWREQQNQEEQRRQDEEIRLRKLQEEFEKEKRNYEKKREEDIKRQQEEERLKNQQREEIEEERKRKEKELKEMEENIKKEREARQKEKLMREEEDRKRKEREAHQRLGWKKTLEDMEEQIKSELEKKETSEKKLKETIEELINERVDLEKKQSEWWKERRQENEQIRTEEQTKLRKLQEEYKTEKENERKKREEEDRIRKQEEKEKKAIEEKLKTDMENLKKTHQDEARKKAEEFNEFKEKHKKESVAQREEFEKKMKDKDKKYDILKALSVHNEEQLKKKHRAGLYDVVKCVTKKKQNMQKINKLLKKHEKEMTEEKTEVGQEKLKETHEEEITDLLEELMNEVGQSSWCKIL